MKIYIDLITNLKDLTIDYLEARTADGRTITFSWDESEIDRDYEKLKQTHILKGISIKYEDEETESYGNGRISELSNLEFTNCGIYSEQKESKFDTILIYNIFIEDYRDTKSGTTIYEDILYENINILYCEEVSKTSTDKDVNLIYCEEAYKLGKLPDYMLHLFNKKIHKMVRKLLKKKVWANENND